MEGLCLIYEGGPEGLWFGRVVLVRACVLELAQVSGAGHQDVIVP